MSNIDKIAEAMNCELTGRVTMSAPKATPEVVLRTFARMGYRAHKYPARDTTSATGLPTWSLDVGVLQLDEDNGRLWLDGRHLPVTADAVPTLGEYQQLAEGILAAVELARTLNTDPESEN